MKTVNSEKPSSGRSSSTVSTVVIGGPRNRYIAPPPDDAIYENQPFPRCQQCQRCVLMPGDTITADAVLCHCRGCGGSWRRGDYDDPLHPPRESEQEKATKGRIVLTRRTPTPSPPPRRVFAWTQEQRELVEALWQRENRPSLIGNRDSWGRIAEELNGPYNAVINYLARNILVDTKGLPRPFSGDPAMNFTWIKPV